MLSAGKDAREKGATPENGEPSVEYKEESTQPPTEVFGTESVMSMQSAVKR